MANHEQAPYLLSVGEKNQECNIYKGFAQRNHFLEYGMMNCLGEKDFAMLKIMLFLTGNQSNVGFTITENTLLSACNISHNCYITNRRKLIARGWIEHEDKKYIKIRCDKIYADIKQKLGLTEITSKIEDNSDYCNSGTIEITSILEDNEKLETTEITSKKLGTTEITSILNTPQTTEITSILAKDNSDYLNFNTEITSKGTTEITYNNIIEQNKKEDNIPTLLYSEIKAMFAEDTYKIIDGICYRNDGKRYKVIYDF